MKKILKFLGLFTAVACAASVHAQTWPSQPIRLIIPYSAGGPTDGMGRLIAQHLGAKLGQPVVVQNKGGAGGTIGVAEVLRSAPDGYTLALVAPGPVAGMHALTTVPYGQDDIEFITLVARNPSVIGVNAKSGISSLQDLIQRAKKAPRTLNFSSAGNGTTPHIGAELFRQQAGIDVVHIPYKGTAPATSALLAGEVDYELTDLSPLLPHHKSGALKILAVAGAKRAPQIPDVPTTVELGLPGVIMETNYGIVGPKGIPADVQNRIKTAITEVVNTPEIKTYLEEQGGMAQSSTPEEYRRLMQSETTKWKDVAKIGNIKLD